MPVDGTPAPEPAVAAPVTAPAAPDASAAAAPAPAAPAVSSPAVAAPSAPAAGEPAPGKPGESLVAAAKPAEPAKPPEAAAPVPIDVATLKLPEGFTLHDKGKEQLAGLLAKNPTVGKEFVEELLTHHAAEVKALADRQLDAWNSTREKWVGEVKADPDIGGRNLEPTLQSIGKAINHFGGADADAIREAFNITGAGDNPQIVRFLSRVAKALNEGGYVAGTTAKPAPKGAAETLWPADESGQVRSTVRNSR